MVKKIVLNNNGDLRIELFFYYYVYLRTFYDLHFYQIFFWYDVNVQRFVLTDSVRFDPWCFFCSKSKFAICLLSGLASVKSLKIYRFLIPLKVFFYDHSSD